MDYQGAWQFLDNLQFFKIKLGLDSMSMFLGRLGHPERSLKFIHVGGTNGKGSVAVSLLSMLSQAGFKTGLYTSPHLSSVRERFRINDSFISRDDFARNASRIIGILGDEQITYFEFTTALALQWFAEQQVDLVILEVGMGGRLDATNVVTPLVSLITNVSMDHEEYLGRTLQEVAYEKSGIIKTGVPVVSGVLAPGAREVVRQRAAELAAPLSELNRDFFLAGEGNESWRYISTKGPTYSGIKLALRGTYQSDNTALALAALDCLAENSFNVSEADMRAGLEKVRWPGRLEYFSITNQKTGKARKYLLDGAHNPAGVDALCQELNSHNRQIIMVWASMADKDFVLCLKTIAPLCREIVFTRPESNRSATPEQLQMVLGKGMVRTHTVVPVEAALDKAVELAGDDDLICVAGSLYLVGKARAILLGELADD